jgi:hypothetical protein
MIRIEKLDTGSKGQTGRFLDFPYRLYRQDPSWVPPLRSDTALALNRAKHPFYEHSEAEFFLATRDGRTAGRLAVLENRPFNRHHGSRHADFYLFECEDDIEIAGVLFERAFEWARARGLDRVVGPKGFSALDGYGIVVEGFQHRQMMTMVNHNLPYYPRLLEALGFGKEVDFISSRIDIDAYHTPGRVRRVADRVQQRGTLRVQRFRDKRHLLEWAPRIGRAYNDAFVKNWEYYPLTEREVAFLVKNVMVLADPKLIKVIVHNDDIVGFLLCFPDISAALQHMRGRLLPFGLFHILRELRRTDWIAINGAGVLPEFHGCGGNALLYTEIEDTVRGSGFRYAHLTQIAESAVQMTRDLEELGARPIKRHRVFARDI